MNFPEYEEITSKTLREIQKALELDHEEMAELLGIAVKTWRNRISAYHYEKNKNENHKYKRVFLLYKLEYEHLKYLVNEKQKEKL